MFSYNGHTYDFVMLSSSTSWNQAATMAANNKYMGQPGYLAIISDAAENAAIGSHVFISSDASSRAFYIGAKYDSTANANSGAYVWQSASTMFARDMIPPPICTPTSTASESWTGSYSYLDTTLDTGIGEANVTANTQPCSYSNWAKGYPNMVDGFCGMMLLELVGQQYPWTTVTCSSIGTLRGYIVEWGVEENKVVPLSTTPDVIPSRALPISNAYLVATGNPYYNRLVLDGVGGDASRHPIATYTWRGHDYALLRPTGLGDARWWASTLSSRGRRGYLVTITSAAEDQFISNILRDYAATTVNGTTSTYINLYKIGTLTFASWKWYNGAESGQEVWAGDWTGRPVSNQYFGWDVSEPRSISTCAVIIYNATTAKLDRNTAIPWTTSTECGTERLIVVEFGDDVLVKNNSISNIGSPLYDPIPLSADESRTLSLHRIVDASSLLSLSRVMYTSPKLRACFSADDITCPVGTQIYIVSAVYGRYDANGCSTSVPAVPTIVTVCDGPSAFIKLSAMCNGRRTCEVQVTRGVYDDGCDSQNLYIEYQYQCRDTGLSRSYLITAPSGYRVQVSLSNIILGVIPHIPTLTHTGAPQDSIDGGWFINDVGTNTPTTTTSTTSAPTATPTPTPTPTPTSTSTSTPTPTSNVTGATTNAPTNTPTTLAPTDNPTTATPTVNATDAPTSTVSPTTATPTTNTTAAPTNGVLSTHRMHSMGVSADNSNNLLGTGWLFGGAHIQIAERDIGPSRGDPWQDLLRINTDEMSDECSTLTASSLLPAGTSSTTDDVFTVDSLASRVHISSSLFLAPSCNTVGSLLSMLSKSNITSLGNVTLKFGLQIKVTAVPIKTCARNTKLDNAKCVPCPPGTFSRVAGASSCLSCIHDLLTGPATESVASIAYCRNSMHQSPSRQRVYQSHTASVSLNNVKVTSSSIVELIPNNPFLNPIVSWLPTQRGCQYCLSGYGYTDINPPTNIAYSPIPGRIIRDSSLTSFSDQSFSVITYNNRSTSQLKITDATQTSRVTENQNETLPAPVTSDCFFRIYPSSSSSYVSLSFSSLSFFSANDFIRIYDGDISADVAHRNTSTIITSQDATPISQSLTTPWELAKPAPLITHLTATDYQQQDVFLPNVDIRPLQTTLDPTGTTTSTWSSNARTTVRLPNQPVTELYDVFVGFSNTYSTVRRPGAALADILPAVGWSSPVPPSLASVTCSGRPDCIAFLADGTLLRGINEPQQWIQMQFNNTATPSTIIYLRRNITDDEATAPWRQRWLHTTVHAHAEQIPASPAHIYAAYPGMSVPSSYPATSLSLSSFPTVASVFSYCSSTPSCVGFFIAPSLPSRIYTTLPTYLSTQVTTQLGIDQQLTKYTTTTPTKAALYVKQSFNSATGTRSTNTFRSVTPGSPLTVWIHQTYAHTSNTRYVSDQKRWEMKINTTDVAPEYAKFLGATSPCLPGQYSRTGLAPCLDPPPGGYTNTTAANFYYMCRGPYEAVNPAHTGCDKCTLFQVSDPKEPIACGPCPPGQTIVRPYVCERCPIDTYSDTRFSSTGQCKACEKNLIRSNMQKRTWTTGAPSANACFTPDFTPVTGIVMCSIFFGLFGLITVFHIMYNWGDYQQITCGGKIWAWTKDYYTHMMYSVFILLQIPWWAVVAGRMIVFPASLDHQYAARIDRGVLAMGIIIIVMQPFRICFSVVMLNVGSSYNNLREYARPHLWLWLALPYDIALVIMTGRFLSFFDHHSMLDVVSSSGVTIERVELDQDKVDRVMAVGAIIMAIFNLHFIIMHFIHVAYTWWVKGKETLINAMHTHFQKYGHIYMQQQAQFDFLVGLLPTAGAGSSVYHAFRADPLYDPSLLALIFDMAFPIDRASRNLITPQPFQQTPFYTENGILVRLPGETESGLPNIKKQENIADHVHIEPTLTPYDTETLRDYFGALYHDVPIGKRDENNPFHNQSYSLKIFQNMVRQPLSRGNIPERFEMKDDAFLLCRPTFYQRQQWDAAHKAERDAGRDQQRPNGASWYDEPPAATGAETDRAHGSGYTAGQQRLGVTQLLRGNTHERLRNSTAGGGEGTTSQEGQTYVAVAIAPQQMLQQPQAIQMVPMNMGTYAHQTYYTPQTPSPPPYTGSRDPSTTPTTGEGQTPMMPPGGPATSSS